MSKTDKELNKKVHVILRICWHENISQIWNECLDCHKHDIELTKLVNFVSTWEGFGIIWEFIQKHERWPAFTLEHGISRMTGWYLPVKLISPSALAQAFVEFFEDK